MTSDVTGMMSGEPDTVEAQPKPCRGVQKGNKNAQKHGHWARKLKLTEVPLAVISQQNGIGREVARQAEAIFTDGGGKANFSEIKQHQVETYLITKLLRESLDHWLLQQPSLINKRKKTAYPILQERNRLVETSLKLAQAIGLERVPKPVPSLQEFLTQHAAREAQQSSSTDSSSRASEGLHES